MRILGRNMEKRTAVKHELRELMKRRRDQIPPGARTLSSRRITESLLSSEWYEKSEIVFVYSAIRSEVDLGAFCEQAWRDNKKLYFPRMEQESMEFCRVDSPAQLVRGSFSVMEPSAGCPKDHCAKCERAPVLVPGVAFSRAGGRIGYGKGYYDRYLAKHPLLVPIGVCFEAQLFDGEKDEMEEHDRWMDWIVTEHGIYRIVESREGKGE